MPILKEPVPSTATVQETKVGERTLIRAIGLHDQPEPGTGNLLGWATFPGSGAVVWYPGCTPLTFAPGAIEIRLGSGGQPEIRARPAAACITIDGSEIHYHPPADRPELRALARLCESFSIPFDKPDAPALLALELARRFCPDAFKPAGRDLTADERRMSIAWLIDQESREGETVRAVLDRLRDKLVEMDLIEPAASASTLLRLAKEGARLLARHGMERWRIRSPGRPKKGTREAY